MARLFLPILLILGSLTMSALGAEQRSSVRWVSDSQVVVSVVKTGTLDDLIDQSACGRVVSLTISGRLSDADFMYIRDNMASLEVLDIGGASNNSLPANMMAGNQSMTKVVLPSNLQSVGPMAFARCAKLKDIVFNQKLQSIGAQAFFECDMLVDIDLPESVNTIGEGAFMRCRSLTKVTLPSAVKYIGGSAFMICPRLYTVVCRQVDPIEITATVFSSMYSQIDLRVPVGSVDKYRASRSWRRFENISEAD